MAGRLSNLRVVDPVLTKLTYGYVNLQFVGTYLFPVVPVEKEAAKIPVWNKDHFKIYNTKRAIRGDTNVINPSGATTVDVTLDEEDLAMPMDYREESESLFDLQSILSYQVSDALDLSLEKAIADLAQTAGTYGVDNRVDLSSGGNVQWTESSSDPISDVMTGREAIRAKIGQYPNVAIIGALTFRALKTNSALLGLLKVTNGIITLDFLKSFFEIPNIYVGQPVYASDAGVFADVWGDNMIMAYVRNSVNGAEGNARIANSTMEPSFAYTLRKTGMPQIDTYPSTDKKKMYIRKTDIRGIKVVGADAGYLIENTNE